MDAADETLRSLFEAGLPMNRKERFFTGTVFPMIVCSDNFQHLNKLLGLAGVAERPIHVSPDKTNVQFFTEYGFSESRYSPASKEKFPDFQLGRDTPDVLIYISGEKPLLLAVESKMYDIPSATDLNRQMARQATLLEYVSGHLGEPVAETKLVSLLPAKLADRVRDGLKFPTFSWEDLLENFQGTGSDYFMQVLELALGSYDDLVSRRPDVLLGSAIVEGFKAGTLNYKVMGRGGGLEGEKLSSDIANAWWPKRAYSCSVETAPLNGNWFLISDFVAKVEAQDLEGRQG